MDPVQRLRDAATGGTLQDEDGDPVRLDLRPPADPGTLSGLRSHYAALGAALPGELVRLLELTSGTEALLDLDLTGERHSIEVAEPARDTTIDDVHEDRLFQVGRRAPHSMPWDAAMTSDDHALREFAASLDQTWTVVDLRRREVGMGVAWGAHGPRTRLARHGWERIFGYAPPARTRRRSIWSRMAFADPTMGIRPVRSRSRARRSGRPAPPPP